MQLELVKIVMTVESHITEPGTIPHTGLQH